MNRYYFVNLQQLHKEGEVAEERGKHREEHLQMVRKLCTASMPILPYEVACADLHFSFSYYTDTDLSKPVDDPPHPNRLVKATRPLRSSFCPGRRAASRQ
jgi:hypothetical protein